MKPIAGRARWLTGAIAAIAASFLLVAAGCGSSKSSTSSSGPITSVTLSGSATGSKAAPITGIQPAGAKLGPMATITNYSMYELFCVTFTNPPDSGTGKFDTNGNFSVTVSNAAGVPVGCFIVDTSNNNATVATLTFTIGTAGGMNTGTTTGPSFAGGTYTISINFNATTGSATANVTAGGTPTTGGSSSLAAADIAGGWQMYCDVTPGANSLPDLAACAKMMNGLTIPALFLDVITATDTSTGQPVYAMGAWPNSPTFVSAGTTEGMAMTNLPSNIGAITSVVTTSTPGYTGSGTPTPRAMFPGFTATNYDYNTNTMSDANVFAWLKTTGLPSSSSQLTAAESEIYPGCFGGGGGSSGNVLGFTSAGAVWPGSYTSPTQQMKQCLLQFMQVAAEMDRNGSLASPFYVPRPLGSNWTNYAGASSTSTNIVFDGSHVGGSPNIPQRFALMGLTLSGNSAQANDSNSDTWSESDPGGGAETCTHSNSTNINLVSTGTGTFDAYFSTSDSQVCTETGTGTATLPSYSNATFKAKMVRPSATLPFGTSIQLPTASVADGATGKTLDGTWGICQSNGSSNDTASMFAIAGTTLVYAGLSFPTTGGTCGNGESGSLVAAVVGTLAPDLTTPTQTFSWSDGTTKGATVPTANAGGSLAVSQAARILGTVTASYGVGSPAPGATAGLLFVLDDVTTGGKIPKLYSQITSPASCAGSPYGSCVGTGALQPIH